MHTGKRQRRGGPSLHGSYDGFFLARSRPSRVQFWGLTLLGGNLIVLGVVLFVTVVRKLAKPNLDIWEGLILLLSFGVCGCIVYFGAQHLARALAGRDGKPSRNR